jgi:two-component system phosphate regulon sensor histidine kinase PhoR
LRRKARSNKYMPVIMSFRAKLILSYIIVVIVSFGAVAFFLDKSLEERSVRTIASSLTAQASLIESHITSDLLAAQDANRLQDFVKTAGQKAECRITIIDKHGKVIADSDESPEGLARMDTHIGRPEVRAALAGGIGVNTRYSPTLRIDMLYAAVPIRDKSSVTGVVRVALPLESVANTLWTIRKIILLGVVFSLALAFILGSLLASQTIKPINRMIHISRKFSEGDFERRIIQAPHDEIGELARTLNTMAQHIEDKIKEVKTQNQRLEAIFNSMIEGVLVVDRSGRIVSINHAIENIFTIKKSDAEGRLLLEAIRNNDIAELIDGILKKGEPLSSEIKLVYPVSRIFQVSATPIFEGERVNGCLAVIHDITEIRRLETVRSDFVANVSHELKTPLTSIKGFVETLLDGAMDDSKNAMAFLKIVHDHTDRLDKLVNDLLVLSHLESKEIKLQRKDFDLSGQVDEIIMGFGSQIKKTGIEIKNKVPKGLSVHADKDRIDQVVTNLIDNGLKFNKEKGTIRIYSEYLPGAVRVIIEDSGTGIPAKDISRIFERFYRVDRARSRDLGGTGLGLSIIKHIVELHGGAVGVESTEGLGSKFWFTIPAR